VERLSAADRALGELAGVGRMLPNPHLLIRPFVRREAVLSSKIEGTVTRLDQLLLFEAQADRDPAQAADTVEVANYVMALEFGLDRVRKGIPLCLRLIKEIHQILLQGVRGGEKRPGEFRTCPVFLGRQGQVIADARFVPPPQTEINQLLSDFEKFLNFPGKIPVLVQVALMHYQFETIHPFNDGNGRIGRLLITLMLCERKILPEPLLYLSAYFEKNRNDYYDGLLKVSQQAAWERWIEFFAAGVTEQAQDAIRRARGMLDLWRGYRKTMQKRSQSSKVLQLVDQLFASPFITIPGAAKLLQVTYAAAQQNVEKLIKAKILREVQPKRKKYRVYFAQQVLTLLEAESAPESELQAVNTWPE
jgi:Fic family protein